MPNDKQLKAINQKNKVDALEKALATNPPTHPHERIQARMDIILARANYGLIINSKR